MKREHWKVIDEFPDYEVSDKGRIRRLTPAKSTYKGKIKNTSINNAGYEIVTFSKKDKKYSRTVHRLVAIAFLTKPDGCDEINHKDENKLNNSVENLEWCTHKYNMNYGTLQERKSKKQRIVEYCTISIPVKTTIYLLDGKTYYNRNQVAQALELSVARICQMLQCGGNRHHTLIKSEKYVMKHKKYSRSYAKKHYAEFIID